MTGGVVTDFRRIYAERGVMYDALVSREDVAGNILRALGEIRPFPWTTAVDLGAGTGRMTRLLLPHVARVIALDGSRHMLGIARKTTAVAAGLAVAQNEALPLPSAVAEVAVAGWSLGHSVGWFPDDWPRMMSRTLDEMRRVVQPDGVVILLETLGTGRAQPEPPTTGLRAFYRWLEGDQGFHHTWIRTDYRFESVAEASRLTRFFFGDALANQIEREALTLLPECTGVWWREGNAA